MENRKTGVKTPGLFKFGGPFRIMATNQTLNGVRDYSVTSIIPSRVVGNTFEYKGRNYALPVLEFEEKDLPDFPLS